MIIRGKFVVIYAKTIFLSSYLFVTKKLFFYYKDKHSKIFEILAMINKALGVEDTKEA